MVSCFLLIVRGKVKCEGYVALRMEIKYLVVSIYDGPFLCNKHKTITTRMMMSR